MGWGGVGCNYNIIINNIYLCCAKGEFKITLSKISISVAPFVYHVKYN